MSIGKHTFTSGQAVFARFHRLQTALVALAILALLLRAFPASAATNEPAAIPLALEDYLRKVWEVNENVQIRTIEAMIAEERYKAEKGIFEPEFIGGFDAADRQRASTVEQRASQSVFGIGLGSTVFNEINRSYSSAVEMLTPIGAKVRFGYSLQSLENNLNRTRFPNGEYLSTIGISITQPLLKNFGPTITLAGIRAAAVSSEISFQEYRRRIIELMTRAELGYWELYQAQEQHGISSESARLAETLLTDNKKRLELGKGTELDVLQAEAGLTLRKAVQSEAVQRLVEARGRAATQISEQGVIAATDAPQPRPQALAFGAVWQTAYEHNPDILSLNQQIRLEEIRLAAARNQRLPGLDLKLGYGATGIGFNAGDSWDNMVQQNFPAWSIGLEFHMPLAGGVKVSHEYKAAQLRTEAARKAAAIAGDELANILKSGIRNVETFHENVGRYQKVVEFNQDVLKTQLARLDAGKTDSRTVLQAEEDVFRAKINLLDSAVRFQRAMLELDLVSGIGLKRRNLDLTQKELKERTDILTQSGRITPKKYEDYLKRVREEYDKRRAGAASGGQ